MSKTYPVFGSSELPGGLVACDLQSSVADGCRDTFLNTGTMELAMDIYGRFA